VVIIYRFDYIVHFEEIPYTTNLPFEGGSKAGNFTIVDGGTRLTR